MIGNDIVHALEKLGIKRGELQEFALKLNRIENIVNSFGRTELGALSGYLKGTAGVLSASTSVPSTDISGDAEAAQDAVGTILTDTATIDFTYDDPTPKITADVKDGSITYAKMQDVSATNKVLGRSTAGSGDVEEIPCTAAGRALIDDADAAAQRTTLGLGTMATQAASAVAITGGSVANITDLAVADGGTGASSAQTAINALTSVSAATNEHVLTKDTGTGNATFKAAAGGVTSVTGTAPIVSSGGTTPAISISAATTGAAGSMSAADKTKLDGATATPTASKIPIADGSGKLDGWVTVGSMYVTVSTRTRAGILAAIATLPSGGGVVYMPGGTAYNIDTDLSISVDGSDTVPSTMNNITLLGEGMGGSEFFKGSGSGTAYVGGATVLQWTNAGGGALLRINGRITGCKIENLVLDGGTHANILIDSNRATLLRVNNVLGYHWAEDFAVRIHNTSSNNYYSAGSMEQVWTNVHMRNPSGSNAHGLDIAPPTWYEANVYNVSECTFVGCSFSRSDGVANVGLRLGFCDHIAFFKTFFCSDVLNDVDGYGIQINPSAGNATYPQDITLHGSPIIGGVHYHGAAHGGTDWTSTVAPAVIFYPYYTVDSQIVPPTDADGGVDMPTAMCGGHTDHYWYHNGVITA